MAPLAISKVVGIHMAPQEISKVVEIHMAQEISKAIRTDPIKAKAVEILMDLETSPLDRQPRAGAHMEAVLGRAEAEMTQAMVDNKRREGEMIATAPPAINSLARTGTTIEEDHSILNGQIFARGGTQYVTLQMNYIHHFELRNSCRPSSGLLLCLFEGP